VQKEFPTLGFIWFCAAQQAWPAPPHALHVPLTQTPPVQSAPGQHAWPIWPQLMHAVAAF
jgi:hypothetical protein